jgi:HAMP domain-containing protein
VFSPGSFRASNRPRAGFCTFADTTYQTDGGATVAVSEDRPKARRAPAKNKSNANGAGTEAELRKLLAALKAQHTGDFDARIETGQGGVVGELAEAFNKLAERRSALTDELQRVARVVNREGRFTERASLPRAGGAWKETVDSVNGMIEDLVRPTTEIARVIDAVAEGDLSQKMAQRIEGRPLRGEFLRIGTTVNAMVDQLSSFAAEVTRVAREVGTEGKLGGQAKVKGVSGVWKDLTDSVNAMCCNQTAQVRNIAQVTTAVARGDLSRKITDYLSGEILELKDT